MPKCPECGAKIDSLEYAETRTTTSLVTLEDGMFSYDSQDNDLDSAEFCCTECDAIICHNEEEAKIFLEGGEI